MATPIKLDDIYANAILDYVLYRAYSKDAEYAANASRAALHYQAFTAALGAKTQVDAGNDPHLAALRSQPAGAPG